MDPEKREHPAPPRPAEPADTKDSQENVFIRMAEMASDEDAASVFYIGRLLGYREAIRELVTIAVFLALIALIIKRWQE